jgi:hypothetical protein
MLHNACCTGRKRVALLPRCSSIQWTFVKQPHIRSCLLRFAMIAGYEKAKRKNARFCLSVKLSPLAINERIVLLSSRETPWSSPSRRLLLWSMGQSVVYLSRKNPILALGLNRAKPWHPWIQRIIVPIMHLIVDDWAFPFNLGSFWFVLPWTISMLFLCYTYLIQWKFRHGPRSH